jgi:hypothetical protein
MSPLVHLPGADDVEAAEVFRPAAARRSAGLRPVHDEDRGHDVVAADLLIDPKIRVAQDHLDELIAIEAGDVAVRVARRALDEAVALVQTERARERSKRMKAAVAEQNKKVKAQRTAEAKARAATSPIVTLEFNGVKVTARPEMPMDPAGRAMIYANLATVQRVLAHEFRPFEPKSTEWTLAQAKDLMSLAIATGAVTIEVI